MDNQPPRHLNGWVTFLKDKPLPVLVGTQRRLNALFKSRDLALAELCPVIASDPVYCLHLVRRANLLNSNPETQANSIELAVSTLGLDRIKELTSELPPIKINHASVAHKQYFHCLANSYHAFIQAEFLCRFTSPSVINDTRLAALFYGLGHWALWRYAPESASRIKIRIYEKQADVALAENDILGCTIQQISEALIREWKVSRLAVEALKHSTSPDAEMLEKLHRHAQNDTLFDDEQLREIKALLNARFYPVKLANWLALTVPYGWEQPKALQLLQIIADFLKHPKDEVSRILHQNCVRASREYHIDGTLSPAAQMLLLPSNLRLSYRLAAKSGTVTATETRNTPSTALPLDSTTHQDHRLTPAGAGTSTENAFKNRNLFIETAERLVKNPEVYSSLLPVFEDLLKGLAQGLGLDQTHLFIINEENQLRPYRQTGLTEKHPLQQFTLDLLIPSLFKQISTRAQCIWVNNSNRENIWPLLPQRFRNSCHQRSFLLMSIIHDKNPVAYLYAQSEEPDTVITAFQHKHFKYLCSATTLCVDKMLGQSRHQSSL